VICLVSAQVAQQWLRMCTYRFRCTAFWVFKCRLAWQDAVACWFSSCWVLQCAFFVLCALACFFLGVCFVAVGPEPVGLFSRTVGVMAPGQIVHVFIAVGPSVQQLMCWACAVLRLEWLGRLAVATSDLCVVLSRMYCCMLSRYSAGQQEFCWCLFDAACDWHLY
jgi:hypothetical protein